MIRCISDFEEKQDTATAHPFCYAGQFSHNDVL